MVALAFRGIEIAPWGKNVRAADDTDEHGAFGFVEVLDVLAKVICGGILHAVVTRADAEINAIQVTRHDFLFAVVFFHAQGEGDFEKFPVHGFGANFIGIPRELHRESGGTLFEFPFLDVAHGGACETAQVHARVGEKFRILAGLQGFDEEGR